MAGNLGGGGVVGDGAIADGPDILSTVDDQKLIDGETAARVLLCGDLAHEVLDDVSDSVTGGPDEQTIGNLFEFFGSVWVGDFGFDVLVGYFLDHCLCADGDFLFLEAGFGVFDELFGEHGQNLQKSVYPIRKKRNKTYVRQSFDKRDMEIVLNTGNPLAQILFKEIL